MNRQGGQPRQSAPVPAGFRSAQAGAPPSQSSGANGMYYASSGAGGAQPNPTGRPGILGQQIGSYPPSGALGRGGPPGFGGRGADPNDFPALGSHSQLSSNSTYAAQAQPSGASNQAQLHQQLYLHQQQAPQQMDSSMPPPPPGLAPTSSSQQPNGASGSEGLRDDFPALGDKDQRMMNMLKLGGAGSAQSGSPQASLNGPSTSQSTSATPSSNPHMPSAGGPPSTAESSWARQSPSRLNEPLVRPVQQIMSSPVDKWGLKALLYEIRTQMGKSDRGMLMFGEDLAELGVDVSQSEPLYSSFVTPWADPNSLHAPPQIEDMFVIPSCYHVVPPPVDTKLPNFSEETLFYIFYSAPQDVVQLMAAEELYNRGWRFNTDLRVWMTSPPLAQIDLHADASSRPGILRGPFTVFNPSTWSRQETAGDFTIDVNSLEATKPASAIVAEKQARKEAGRSPNGNNSGLLSNVTNPAYQNMQAAH